MPPFNDNRHTTLKGECVYDYKQILSKDIWVRTAETQPFFAFLSIIQNFSLGRVVII